MPAKFALSVCRIEPENNIAMILEAWQRIEVPLVIVGNWDNSDYGRDLRARHGGIDHLHLLDPIYEPGRLRSVRDRASCYVHGHSAGGTNPSLVEIMHFGIPVMAHGCSFNRYTTEGKASYFMNSVELETAAHALFAANQDESGKAMLGIARRRYTWEVVGKAYFEFLGA